MARYHYQKESSPSVLSRLIKWCFVLGLWAILGVGCVLAWYARELPDIIDNPKFERKASITVLANDGSVIARYGDIKGHNISADSIPKNLANAILATEDRRFYYHFGLDPIGLLRAMFVNLTHKGLVQGGSTITQQLAKNLFLSQERTLKRKLQEAMLAVWLEYKLTKDEILASYMNRVYLGAGTYGVEAASRVYFQKSASNLTLQQTAILAGLLKAPSRYSPLSNPAESETRAKVVLAAMVDAGYITSKEAARASRIKLDRKVVSAVGQSSHYFSDWVVDNLDNLIGIPKEDIIVETTMDPQVQESTANILKTEVESNSKNFNVTQSASIVLRPDGSIVAMVGGIDYNKSEYNRVTQGLRQPGSSFKPFVYLAAIEQGANEYTPVLDAPIKIGKYAPQNFGNKYYGDITLIDALTLSLNTVSVRIAQAVGVDNVINVARRAGITADLEPNLSLALGSSEIPMTEMAQAYATLNNGGYAVQAFGIRKIKTSAGKILFEYKAEPAPRVFRDTDIQVITNMMMSVVQNGTGQAARSPFFVAGKTGTTQDHRDAWFDGFSRDYVAVVWFGNDNNNSMKASMTGGAVPARAWKQIITAAKSDPSPSSYELIKGESIVENDFSHMLGSLMSEPLPSLQERSMTSDSSNFVPTPTFTPDKPGDKVGYQRLND
ncbi:MAG: PBP1A family penicillin-binding protein [Alphaproteobacteria bacterium]|nr:PBP1A family penicillin-binding protein [Alphaproteobacteria bacterium]